MEHSERWRIEWQLSSARAVLALVSLAVLGTRLHPPPSPEGLALPAAGTYTALAVATWLWLWRKRKISARAVLFIHGVDVLWAALITAWTQGPNSPFFVFLSFVLLEAAFRWGLVETLWTACAAMGLLLGEAWMWEGGAVAEPPGLARALRNQFLMRATFLLLLSFLLGYLAEAEKRLRRRASVVAEILAGAQRQPGLRGMASALLREFVGLYQLPRALFIAQENPAAPPLVWEARREDREAIKTSLLPGCPEDVSRWFSLLGATACWQARWRAKASSASLEVVAIDEAGQWVHRRLAPEEGGASSPGSWRSLAGVRLHRGGDWQGWLLLVEPRWRMGLRAELQFLCGLAEELAPAVENVFLLRRLRSRAAAVERGRIARELHDGAIQSLLAAEMELAVLERQLPAQSEATAGLQRAREVVRQQALALRGVMELLRPLSVTPEELPQRLTEAIEQFRRETGIEASFEGAARTVDWSPRTCREVVRIVQEGLFNVRRHSRATQVRVCLQPANGSWRLTIEDNGRGFAFSGVRSLEELETLGQGPRVICERVRALGGQFWVDSRPGQGARLLIELPPGV